MINLLVAGISLAVIQVVSKLLHMVVRAVITVRAPEKPEAARKGSGISA
jgi:hypothetical protein